MDATCRQDEGAPRGTPGDGRLWLLPVLALLAWQGWLTLALFGPDDAWNRLTDERPLVCGKHPLHLYHGTLGARAFLRSGSASCYDPAFQAGYPKTPVFDGGSRPAEIFLLTSGGDYRPSVYKIGLALSCLLVPVVLCLASRGAGLSRRAVFLAVLLGQLVWWGRPCQSVLEDGDLDLLLASLAALALAGLLLRYDRKPGGRAYLGTLLAGALAWMFQPLLIGLLLPVFLVYYLSVGVRHRMLWSVLLLGGLFLCVLANFFWLREWVSYWWLRVPLTPSELLLPHRTVATLWRAPLWGDELDRSLTLALLLLGTVGAVGLNQTGKRPAARLFGLAALLLILLAIGGILNELLGKFNASGLLVPGLLFAAPLAAHGLELACRGLVLLTGRLWATLVLASAALAAGLLWPDVPLGLQQRATTTAPLHVGLADEALDILDKLDKHTTNEARILWESLPRTQPDAGWTALLPLLTDRSFLGGLDASAGIVHTIEGLSHQLLVGRDLNEWTDDALADYCVRYNVGWIVCSSPPAKQRLQRWSRARRVCQLGAAETELFAINRKLSFVLKGKARWLGAEPDRIRLADVVPENGEVILSLHYQQGLVAAPARVEVEPCLDPRQDIPFIRLRVAAPVAHLTLHWHR